MPFHGMLLDKETMSPNVSLALSCKGNLIEANCLYRKEKKHCYRKKTKNRNRKIAKKKKKKPAQRLIQCLAVECMVQRPDQLLASRRDGASNLLIRKEKRAVVVIIRTGSNKVVSSCKENFID